MGSCIQNDSDVETLSKVAVSEFQLYTQFALHCFFCSLFLHTCSKFLHFDLSTTVCKVI